MKLCVSSYSYSKHVKAARWTYGDICRHAKETGFDGIEFIELDSPVLGIASEPEFAADEIRGICACLGLEVVAYTVGANFLAEDLQAELSTLRSRVDIAARLGAPILRHDVCAGPRPVHGYHYTDAIAEMLPGIREIAAYAEARGIRTCTENHGRYFQDPERVEALIRTVNHPNYGWLVDFGNFMGVDADVTRAVSIAVDYAVHVHAKDVLAKPGTQPKPYGFYRSRLGNYLRGTVIGHGAVPVAQCINILKEHGYDRYVCVEFEGWEETLPSIEAGYHALRALI